MKRMMKYMAALLAGSMLFTAACSEDYLETSSSNSLSDEVLSSDVTYYGQYINGISWLMVFQQGTYGQGYCGMCDILTDIGDSCGNDWSQEAFGGFNSANMKLMTANNAAYAGYSWWFLYQIIGQANRILAGLETAEGDEATRALYKAQALTFRAYCYSYLAQIFGKRWMDDQGASQCCVLRLTNSLDNMPLSTTAEVLAQVYQDCDDAIALYQEAGIESTEFYHPSLKMAYGVKARAAAVRLDWTTAATYSAKAYEGMTLMSASEYQAGFHTANSEWIYGGYADEVENMWYYTFGTYHGYNGYYSGAGGYNVLGNRELIDALNDTDARKQLFLCESLVGYNCQDAIDNGEVITYGWAYPGGQLANKMFNYALSIPGVYNNIMTTRYYPARFAIYGQLKFGVFGMPGISQMCWMRAAEFYLLQAEALCKQANPDYATAQNLLFTVNSRLDPSYTKSTKTGQDLIDEIMFYRRAELWGEGHNWFDLKRTGGSISRKSYMNKQGGSFGINFAVTVGPNDEGTNDWAWTIPLDETQYNDMVE